MKATDTKTTTQLHTQSQAEQQPFFQKEGAGRTSAVSEQPFFQPKLKVGKPGDKYEREADATADRVVNQLPAPAVQAKCAACEAEEEEIQRKPIFESAEEHVQQKAIAPSLQPQEAEAAPEEEMVEVPEEEEMVQAKCAACEEEETDNAVQAKAEAPPQQAGSDLESRLNSTKGKGSPLPEETQTSMGTALGADFGGVRVHTDSSAVQMSQELGAHAFTHGSDIYFNAGKYDTGSKDGQKLLAHELVHTVQQGGGDTPSLQKSEAQDLIDERTSWGNLDEEGLGQDLASRLPGEINLVNQVLNELSESDRDDVSFEIVRAPLNRLGNIPESLRIRFINEMVHGVVTDEEEGAIADLWISFVPSLPDVAQRHRELWKKSLWESDQLIEYLRPIIEAFRLDVAELARAYLAENDEVLLEEAFRFGVDLENEISLSDSLPGYLEAVRSVAPKVLRLKNYLNELQRIHVGYNYEMIGGPHGEGTIQEMPATFNPDRAPDIPPRRNEFPAWPTWDEVKLQYDRVGAIIASFASLYPSIFVLIQQDSLEELTELENAELAREKIIEALTEVREKISESDNKIVTRDIEYYDLMLLYEQLFNNSVNVQFSPRHPWNQEYYMDIARDDLKGHEARQFWVDLGLSLAAAAALIAAPFTGGATAALLVGIGVGIGIGQAGVSWERYFDMATLGDSNAREELALISQGQISAQLLEAIINTVAVFLDVYGAGTAVRGVGAGTRVGRAGYELAERELREQLADEARRRAVRSAVREGALTTAGAGASVGLHEMAQEEPIPDFTVTAEGREFDLNQETAEDSSGTVSRMIIQLTPGYTPPTAASVPTGSSGPIQMTGPEFELHIEQALKRNAIGGLPQMDFVIPGQYTGSGWGIDRFGISINESTGRVSMYHFEMKFVSPESPRVPQLGTPSAGTQTGRNWTHNAIESFLNSQRPEARRHKERLRRAMQSMYPGEYVDINRMREFLRRRLRHAPVIIFTPDYADLRTLTRQVIALVRWGRNARIIRVVL